ncbi:MAG: AI-2E family transporter [Alphaproteobacteria bacterium]|nr:AI-2E family transporter [Alphaproteobacteria bacterium]
MVFELHSTRDEIAAEAGDLPLIEPPETRTVFLGGILLILSFIALKLGSAFFIPLFFAIILKFVLQPAMRGAEKMRLPRKLAAGLIVLMLLAGVGGVASVLATPASEWMERIPEGLPQLKDKFRFLSKPVEKTQAVLAQAENMTTAPGQKIQRVMIQGTRLSDRFFNMTQVFVSAALTTILILFFLLAGGDTFLRRFVEILPTFRNKRQAVDITKQVEGDISVYLGTVTLMNTCVGVATALAMRAFGLGDPVLWGAVAFLLNYLPIVGVMLGTALLTVVGFMEIADFWMALLPAAAYFGIHMLESSVITPMLLAKRLTLNPVLVILSLVFWYWMWGFAGAVMAVPMLAITKIVCDRVEKLRHFGHFLGA